MELVRFNLWFAVRGDLTMHAHMELSDQEIREHFVRVAAGETGTALCDNADVFIAVGCRRIGSGQPLTYHECFGLAREYTMFHTKMEYTPRKVEIITNVSSFGPEEFSTWPEAGSGKYESFGARAIVRSGKIHVIATTLSNAHGLHGRVSTGTIAPVENWTD